MLSLLSGPIHLMVDSQDIEGVRLLIKHNADLDVMNDISQTGCPLMLAVENGLYNYRPFRTSIFEEK